MLYAPARAVITSIWNSKIELASIFAIGYSLLVYYMLHTACFILSAIYQQCQSFYQLPTSSCYLRGL